MLKFNRKEMELARNWNKRMGNPVPKNVRAFIIMLHSWKAFIASNEMT